MAQAAAPHPSTSLGTPGGTCQRTAYVVVPSNDNCLLSGRTQAPEISRFARIPFSVTVGSRQAAKSRPAPGATLDLPRLSAPLSRLPASAPLPRAPGSALPGARTRAATTDEPHAFGWRQGPDTRT